MIAPDLLLDGYARGIFPMAMEDGEIAWFSPDPRAIIPIDDGFHIPHGLKRVLKKNPFELRINTAFIEVMHGCAQRDETWINQEIFESYYALFRMGYAHSVEMWLDGRLVGGLYGVALGGAFFGESMFHYETDASKVALVKLVERLRLQGFSLLDTQWTTPHLLTFGTQEIPRAEYLRRLSRAMRVDCVF